MHKTGLVVLVSALVAGSTPAASAERAAQPAILFERSGDLHAISLDGSRTVRLTKTLVWDELEPAASPDGRSIAYARRRKSGGASAIWVMRVGQSLARLTSRSDYSPAWSPDGRTVYFSRVLVQTDKGPDFSLYEYCGSIFRIGADGSDPRRLTNPPWKDSFHSHFDPAVSPDGLRIAFTDIDFCSGGTASFALRVIDSSGRVTEDLALLPGNAYYPVPPEYESPSWSPDGRWLALIGDRRVFVARRDGTQRRRVTPKGLLATDVSWSPDGKWIAFTGGPARSFPNVNLYVIHPDGTGLRRLTRTPQSESSPTWMPTLPAP